MIPSPAFDTLTLRAVTDELAGVVLGGQIQEIIQPSGDELCLAIRVPGRTVRVLFSRHPHFARVHITGARINKPREPPPFCMACRKWLENGVVTGVQQRGFDRILDITVRGAEGKRATLVAELMGRHSNLILLDAAGTIIDAIYRVSANESRLREVMPGRTYLGPPADDRADPFATPVPQITAGASDDLSPAAILQSKYAGMSPFIAREAAARIELMGVEVGWDSLFGASSRNDWTPTVLADSDGKPTGAWPLISVQWERAMCQSRESISDALDEVYAWATATTSLDDARRIAAAAIEAAVKRRRERVAGMERGVAEEARAGEYRVCGEMLVSMASGRPAGSESITLVDPYTGEDRIISLDPAVNVRENAERFFKLYRKSRDGAAERRIRLAEARAELAVLEPLGLAVNNAGDLDAVLQVHRSAIETGLLSQKSAQSVGQGRSPQKPAWDGHRIKTVVTDDGYTILVGLSSTANDYLTTRVAHPSDWWLHVRASAGAHVVIRTDNKPQQVPQNVLRQAAELAARQSADKHSGHVDVDYTLKRYVRKPRGAAPGLVVIQNAKTIGLNLK